MEITIIHVDKDQTIEVLEFVYSCSKFTFIKLLTDLVS